MLLDKEDSLLLLIDVQEKLVPVVLNREPFIQCCEWMLKLAQRMNIPILVSEEYPQGLGSTLKQFQAYFNQQNCIDKLHFSCMSEPKFKEHLTRFQKKQLILIGMETHVCVLQTALEMRSEGYDVFVVVDAVSCRGEQNRSYGLKRMKQAGVYLVTSEMVFFEWLKKAGTPEFKMLSKEFF